MNTAKTLRKLKAPQEGAEYTFRIYNKTKKRIGKFTFEFDCWDEQKNKYRFINVATQTYVWLSARRFDYLCGYNLAFLKLKSPKTVAEDNGGIIKMIRNIVDKLQSYNIAEKYEIEKANNVNISDLIARFELEIEHVNDNSEEATARFSALMRKWQSLILPEEPVKKSV